VMRSKSVMQETCTCTPPYPRSDARIRLDTFALPQTGSSTAFTSRMPDLANASILRAISTISCQASDPTHSNSATFIRK
jgi:hypothetical protein